MHLPNIDESWTKSRQNVGPRRDTAWQHRQSTTLTRVLVTVSQAEEDSLGQTRRDGRWWRCYPLTVRSDTGCGTVTEPVTAALLNHV